MRWTQVNRIAGICKASLQTILRIFMSSFPPTKAKDAKEAVIFGTHCYNTMGTQFLAWINVDVILGARLQLFIIQIRRLLAGN